MKIEAIEVVPIEVQGSFISGEVLGAGSHPPPRAAIVTRLLTSESIKGECITTIGYGLSLSAVVRVIEEEIEPLLRGMDVFSVEQCWRKMLPVTFSPIRDRRVGVRAQACVDSAIWDAVGKAWNIPLYRLWGGARDELSVVELGGFWQAGRPYSDYGKYIESMIANDVGGCKFKVGLTSLLPPEEEAKRIRVAREAGGPNFLLIADANGGWNFEEALCFARAVEDLDLLWFEEPCHWYSERTTLPDIRRMSKLRVAAGQMELAVQGCRELMTAGAIDVCNFDASWGGGPTAWRRVAAIAESYGVEMSQHQEPQIGAQLSAGAINGTILEVYSAAQDPIWDKFYLNRPRYKAGKYQLGNEPGWGLTIDPRLVEKFKLR